MSDALSIEQQTFLDEAIAFSEKLEGNGLVLLVGSRGAGYTDDWSDLDLWVLGSKESLGTEQRRDYDQAGQVFVERGDSEAHWTFYDWEDLISHLDTHPPVFTWLACNSQCLHGPSERHEFLRCTYSLMPRPVAEQAMRRALGQFMMESGGGSPWLHGVMPHPASPQPAERSTRSPAFACLRRGDLIRMGSG